MSDRVISRVTDWNTEHDSDGDYTMEVERSSAGQPHLLFTMEYQGEYRGCVVVKDGNAFLEPVLKWLGKPDPMTDPKGTLYIAPSGDVYRHDGLSPEWLAREGHPVHADFKVMLLDRGFSTRDELPEGSYIVWRPTDG